MYLIDSNIIIYSALSENAFLRFYIQEQPSFTSSISQIEVLGFKGINEEEKQYFESCFSLLNIINLDNFIISKAIKLRQKYKISLGDSIIAATAIIYNLNLLTRNIEDFEKVEELKIVNPFK